MSDVTEALFGEKTETPPVVETPPPVEGGPARDESGRFASKPVEQPKVETPVAVTPPAIEQPKAPELPKQPSEHGGLTGPALAAVLDEREKRKALEAELKELRSKQQQPETLPSFQTPEEIAAYIQQQAAQVAWTAKAEWSEEAAREKHGEIVDKAIEWAYAKGTAEKQRLGFSPFAHEQTQQRHPVDWVVKQYKRDQRAAEMPDDDEGFKTFIEKRARELGLIPNANPAPPQLAAQPQPAAPQPAKPDPFRQFDSAPSAGGPMTPIVKLNSVEERLFGKT